MSSIVLFWTWDASLNIAILDLMVGVALTSSIDSFSTWFGVASCCKEAIFAEMASLGFMDEERRLGVIALLMVAAASTSGAVVGACRRPPRRTVS